MNKVFLVSLFAISATIASAQVERVKDPYDAEFLGSLMLSEKRYDDASACLKRGLELAKRDSLRIRIASRLLDAYCGLKDVKRMEDAFEYLLPKMSPKNKVLLKAKYASNLIKLKKVEEARKVLDSASFAKDIPKRQQAHMYYETAQAYRSMKKYAKAGELFMKAGDMAETLKRKASYYNAVCYFPADPSLDTFKRRFAEWVFKQKGLLSYKGLAVDMGMMPILNRDKKYDEAIKLNERYLRMLKQLGIRDSWKIHYNIAVSYERKGDLKRALENCELALRDPKIPNYNKNAIKRTVAVLNKRLEQAEKKDKK